MFLVCVPSIPKIFTRFEDAIRYLMEEIPEEIFDYGCTKILDGKYGITARAHGVSYRMSYGDAVLLAKRLGVINEQGCLTNVTLGKNVALPSFVHACNGTFSLV